MNVVGQKPLQNGGAFLPQSPPCGEGSRSSSTRQPGLSHTACHCLVDMAGIRMQKSCRKFTGDRVQQLCQQPGNESAGGEEMKIYEKAESVLCVCY